MPGNRGALPSGLAPTSTCFPLNPVCRAAGHKVLCEEKLVLVDPRLDLELARTNSCPEATSSNASGCGG